MKRLCVVATCLVLAGLAGLAWGDVVIEAKMTTNMMGMGEMKTDIVQYIRADRSYGKMKSGGMMGGGEMAEVVRLDKGVQWMIMPQNKTYSEFTLADLKKMMAQTPGEAASAEDDNYTWVVKVEASDLKETIGSWPSTGIRATAVGASKEDKSDSVFIKMEYWFSQAVPGGDEFTAYTKKYTEAIGLEDDLLSQFTNNASMGPYKGALKDLSKAFVDKEGVPVKVVFDLASNKNPMGEDAGDEEEMDEEAKAMMEKMGLKMPQKGKNESGRYGMMSMTMEVVKAEKKAVEDINFEVPAGYTKQAMPMGR